MNSLKVWQSVLILGTLVTSGLCIKCFQCNSVEHSDCGDLTVNDTNSSWYKDCPSENGREYFCRKITQLIKNSDDEDSRTVRKCGWLLDGNDKREDKCEKSDTDFIVKTSCVCFGDACNSVPKFRPLFSLTVASTIFFLLSYL